MPGGKYNFEQSKKGFENRRGRNNPDHFHHFNAPPNIQQHLQQHSYPSAHTTAIPPRKMKHTHSPGNTTLPPQTHQHVLGRNIQRHWGRNPGIGPQSGYNVQESAGGGGVHGYSHKHAIGGGRGKKGKMGRPLRAQQLRGGRRGGRARSIRGGFKTDAPGNQYQ